MEAAAIRREVEKARKAKRANRALENSDDDQDVEVVEHVTAVSSLVVNQCDDGLWRFIVQNSFSSD